MCEPTAIALGSFALGAGGAIAGHQAQNKAARANRAAAAADGRMQQYDLGIRQTEELIAATRELEAGFRQGREASSVAVASAAEAGVAGMAVDLLLGDIERDQLAHAQSVEDNVVVTLDQLQRMKMGAATAARNNANAVPGASGLATGLQVVGAGIDLAGRLRGRKPPAGS